MFKVKELWEKACQYDDIDEEEKFVVFSKDNPFIKPYNDAIEKEFQAFKNAGFFKGR